MKFKRRTMLITETERQVSISVRHDALQFFCAECDEPVEMFSINEAAKELKKAWREIVSSIDSGTLHSTETGNGEIYVCRTSLIAESNISNGDPARS